MARKNQGDWPLILAKKALGRKENADFEIEGKGVSIKLVKDKVAEKTYKAQFGSLKSQKGSRRPGYEPV